MTLYTPKALLFDLDGVLINSIDSWWHALNKAFQHYGHQPITKQEFIHGYWGHDLRDILPKQHMDLGIASFCSDIYHHYIHTIAIYEDTVPTLKQLTNIPKAIITNTPSTCTHPILKRFNLTLYFKTVVCSDDVIKAKPDPALIFEACRRLQFHPPETVIIGDTKSDIQAANAARCPIIGKNIQGNSIITTLSDLISLIKI
jgi:HAD superfamily hydrolase (TIGR01509 family)